MSERDKALEKKIKDSFIMAFGHDPSEPPGVTNWRIFVDKILGIFRTPDTAPDGVEGREDGFPGCGDCRVCLATVEVPGTRMVLCPDCHNKRCPRAEYHGYACSGSNEPGQTPSFASPPASEETDCPSCGATLEVHREVDGSICMVMATPDGKGEDAKIVDDAAWAIDALEEMIQKVVENAYREGAAFGSVLPKEDIERQATLTGEHAAKDVVFHVLATEPATPREPDGYITPKEARILTDGHLDMHTVKGVKLTARKYGVEGATIPITLQPQEEDG